MSEAVGKVLIVGAGQAGGEAAQRLRAAGFAGDITLVGDEPIPPYQRPPLSKKYLAGELPLDRLFLRPIETYEGEGIRTVFGRRAVWIDRTAKRVRFEGAHELAYDALILATGTRPRALPAPGADLPGVHVLRTAGDVDAIRPRFKAGAKLVVIGAGYIGLEVAAVARQSGLEVTVVEAAVRPLARVTCPEMAGFFLDVHTAAGVRFMLSSQVAVLKGEHSVRAVGLADGTEIEADLVVVGIGVTADTTLAEKAGLTVQDGIVVDAAGRTSDPAIYAIGDCARRPLAVCGGRMVRLESVHNAIEGAKIVAAAITGSTPPVEETPWFWSDQYDLKLQIAGLFHGFDRTIVRGAPADRAFAVFYLQGERLLAVDAVNRPAEYLGGKALIQKGASPDPKALADPAVPMKALLTA